MRYKFYLQVNDGGAVEVNPRFTDGQRLTVVRDGDRRMSKTQMSGPFRFVRGDGFELIADGALEDQFVVDIFKYDSNENEVPFFRGTFSRTDCEIDNDEGWALARLTWDDPSTKFEENEDTEYDLIKLSTPKVAVSYYAYPLLQVYTIGNSNVTNLQLRSAWQSNVEPVNAAAGLLTNDLNFGQPQRLGFAIEDEGIPFPIGGIYTGSSGSGELDDYFNYINSDGVRIVGPALGNPNYIISWQGGEIGTGVLSEGEDFVNVTLDVGTGETWNYRFYFMNVVARVLTREGITYNGTLGTELTQGDRFAEGTIFTHSQPVAVSLSPSVLVSGLDQTYGVYPGDLYSFSGSFILPPTPSAGGLVIPSGRERWGDVSWWVDVSAQILNSLISGREKIKILDAFKIGDVIKSLVDAGESGLNWANNSSSSKFLYDPVNPVDGGDQYQYVVVPKSNLLTINYDTPAGKAPMSLKELSEMLRHKFQAEFSKDGVNLILESQKYYHQGGSYILEDTESVAFDFTVLQCPFTKRPYAQDANKFTFDKDKLPERLVFSHMDESSPAFKGVDILMISPYVQSGKKELMTVSLFSTDLPLALSTPGAFSETGYFLLACVTNQESGELEVAEVDVPGYGPIQNGALAWPTIHERFYTSYLPARVAQINGAEVVAQTVRRTKRQILRVGAVGQINLFDKVQTGLGSGVVDNIEESLSDGSHSLIIMHEPQ